MGLFGPSKAELEERIHELENDLESVRHTAQQAEVMAKSAENAAYAANKVAHALNDLHTDDMRTIADKSDEVEELDEPHIAWKAGEKYIIKLLLPEGTTVVHPKSDVMNGRKKRGNQAIILGFYRVRNTDGWYGLSITDDIVTDGTDYSMHDETFEYNVGEMVEPRNPLNTHTEISCASGIHFFASKDEALEWY